MTELSDLRDLGEKLKALKAALGAPGDYGYNTPEGAALFALYSSPGWTAAAKALAITTKSAEDKAAWQEATSDRATPTLLPGEPAFGGVIAEIEEANAALLAVTAPGEAG